MIGVYVAKGGGLKRRSDLLHWIPALAGALLLAATAAYAALTFVAVLVWQLRSVHRRPRAHRAPVTLLKPLCGAEPQLYENLRSFCRQDYPTYQIVFGARAASDPAVALVRRLALEFPALPIDLVIDGTQHGSNRKVSNLINMLPRARHDLLIVADSDARVAEDYLGVVTRPLLEPRVGLVTCIYRSIPAGGIWSRLGSMYINDWYMPSVMLAWLFGHRGYASGQTMALRRDALEAAGGFRSIVNHLADDYQLGRYIRKAGLRIELSNYTVETVQSEPTADALMLHELRWMRTVRVLAPGGFGFLFVTFTLPLLVLAAALAAAEPALCARLLPLVWLAALARFGLSSVQRLGQRGVAFSDLALLPLRDVLLCRTWWRALFTSRLVWRGSEYEVNREGIMSGPE